MDKNVKEGQTIAVWFSCGVDNNRFRFRAWNSIVCRYQYFTLKSILKIEGDIQWHILTIEQCTGLNDKNGKLIYEGDILSDGTDNLMIVKFDEEESNLVLKSLKYRTQAKLIYAKFFCEVIGNIHENPELLEG